VHELGLDGAGQGVSVSSARALATSGHRRGSTALLVGDVACIVGLRARLLMLIAFAFGLTESSQLPHMKTSLPEIIDPKVIVFRDFCSLFHPDVFCRPSTNQCSARKGPRRASVAMSTTSRRV
jgi:hypothetical protein